MIPLVLYQSFATEANPLLCYLLLFLPNLVALRVEFCVWLDIFSCSCLMVDSVDVAVIFFYSQVVVGDVVVHVFG